MRYSFCWWTAKALCSKLSSFQPSKCSIAWLTSLCQHVNQLHSLKWMAGRRTKAQAQFVGSFEHTTAGSSSPAGNWEPITIVEAAGTVSSNWLTIPHWHSNHTESIITIPSTCLQLKQLKLIQQCAYIPCNYIFSVFWYLLPCCSPIVTTQQRMRVFLSDNALK